MAASQEHRLDPERLERLMAALEENAEALETLLRLVGELKRSGLLDAMLALAEASDELFSAMATQEVAKPLGNAMMLLYLLGNLDQDLLMAAAARMPKCMDEARRAASEARPMTLREMIRTITSPEFAAALRAFKAAMACARSGGGGEG